jgi:hypothetical protein
MKAEPQRRPVRMVRVLRHPQEDDGSFDLEFWGRVGAEGRFAAAWEMISEATTLRGEDAGEPRLQRSVLRVLRR